MSIGVARARPPRCTLVNLDTGEEKPCLFNPSQFGHKRTVGYARAGVVGGSYQPLQFTQSSNEVLSGVEFYMDAILKAELHGDPDVMDFRDFLRAFTVPRRGAQTVAHNSPPRMLFVWPQNLTFEVVVTSLDFKFTHFDVEGGVLRYTAVVDLEEVLDENVFSEDLRYGGPVNLGVIDLTTE